MPRLYYLLLFSIVFYHTVACSNDNDPQSTAPPCDNPYDTSPLTSEDSNVVFDDARFMTYHLTVQPEQWTWLNTHIADEEYVEAQLAVGGYVIGTVGLRYKGGYGTLFSCLDEQNQSVCPKLPIKLKFNKFEEDKRFFGLKRLNFHAMRWDPSLMHDRLAYDMFREMDIFAPRASHAKLVINGENIGVFSLVEQVDGRFTDNRFPNDGDGNLYKEIWPLLGPDEYYQYGLKTNSQSPDHSGMRGFANALAAAADAATTPANYQNPNDGGTEIEDGGTDGAEINTQLVETIETWTDYDYLMRYIAVDRAIASWDGIMGWYKTEDFVGDVVQSQPFHSHNYYWYVSQNNQRLWLIPWDLDNTFVPSSDFVRLPNWNDTQVDCHELTRVFGGKTRIQSPACNALTAGLAQDGQRYLAAVARLINGPLNSAIYNAKLDRWSAQISEAVATDTNGPGLETFQHAVERLRKNLSTLAGNMQSVIDTGAPTRPYWLDLSKVTDMETNQVAFAQGVYIESNTHSMIELSLNSENPISDTLDLRFDFKFKNQSEGPEIGEWEQYGLVLFMLEDEEGQDLLSSGITKIRFKAKANGHRPLRIEAQSYSYSDPDSYLYLGWDVQLTDQAQTFELAIQDAAWPSWSSTNEQPQDTIQTIFNALNGLRFSPEVLGRNNSGFFSPGNFDEGFVQIDDIEFIK